MLNIYNSKIWKEFLLYLDILDAFKFFTSKIADLYLEIIINLDWF